MKKTMKFYKSIAVLGCLLLTAVACEKDFSTIESDIEGIKDFTTNGRLISATMYDQKLEPVQTNSLSSNLLGVYTDNVYGKTTASIVSQVVPTSFDFSFGEDPQVESVKLIVPFFSTVDDTDDDGNSVYSLDSIYGANQSIKLSIYENTYFLRDYDPSTDQVEPQKFYSNANETINFNNYTGKVFYTNDTYLPDSTPIIEYEIDEETGEDDLDQEISRSAPGLEADLDNSDNFWDNLFFFNTEDPESHTELSNANNFKNYFRGLYFKAEELGTAGHMALMDFANASIVITFSTDISDEDDDTTEERDERTITMTFTGNTLNTIENSAAVENIIDNATATTDMVNGDESVYIKGGEGSFGVIDLFTGDMLDDDGNTVSTLEYFKSKKDKWLINEANLTLYVNQNVVNNSGQEPERIILYDLNNNTPIVDYYLDPTVTTTDPLNSRTYHSSRVKRGDSDEGLRYKIRLTEHVNNVLLRDSTNLKLGVYVTSNINLQTNAGLLNVLDRKAPNGSVLSPRGTVLYGSNPNVPEDSKLEFKIFYTEPNN
ncbi:DUF4270 domain-containing protein [Bizionia sp. KMM 8389]